jgi:hypothetical protein
MDLTIRNSNDLKAEIFRLEGLEKQQGLAIRERFSTPSAMFSTAFSFFSGTQGSGGNRESGVFNQDIIGLISRFLLPLTLNKTIFRNSGFVIKTLVGLISQKASNYISEDSVSGFWHKITSLFEDQDGKHTGGIVGTIKSLFANKKPAKAANHPAYVPSQQNVLKSNL